MIAPPAAQGVTASRPIDSPAGPAYSRRVPPVGWEAVMLNRRAFLCGCIATVLIASPAVAQQAGKVFRIGFLAGGPTPPVEQFRHCLPKLGYVEGTNTIVERRWTEGRAERAEQLAAELVGLKPDVIVVLTAPPALAMKKATSHIPVVFASVPNPVEIGLVSSIARPGANLTGIAWEATLDTTGKAVQLLKEATPSLRRLAVLWNPAVQGARAWTPKIDEAGRTLGVSVE
jgi:putative tryptophan/tyrosine transport system substrate-binding protein